MSFAIVVGCIAWRSLYVRPYQPSNAVLDLAWSPDGEFVAASGINHVAVWPRNGATAQWRFWQGGDFVGVAFDEQGVTAVSLPGHVVHLSADRGTVVSDTSVSGLEVLPYHTQSSECVRLSPDGRLLLVQSSKQRLTLWDIALNSKVVSLKLGDEVMCAALALSSDGLHCAATWRDDNRVAVSMWDLSQPEPHPIDLVVPELGECDAICFSADRVFLAGTELVVMDFAGALLHRQPIRLASCLDVDSESGLIAVGCFDGIVQLWENTTAPRLVCEWPRIDQMMPNAIAISPDGKKIAVGGAHTWLPPDGSGGFWVYDCSGRIKD